jgi:two-component system OmpR family sensor kinase
MALVLGATGVFVYLRFSAELDATINSGLRSRASDVAALVREADSGLGEGPHRLVAPTESFAEVLDANGHVSDSSLAVGSSDLLSSAELRRALRAPILLNRGSLPGLQDHSRLLAVPVDAKGQSGRVVVVGTSTAARNDSLGDLLQLLLVGGPVALALASLAAYGVAAAALHPVEAMRSRAAEVSAAEPDQRLPVPPTRDEVARLGTTLNEMLERLGEAFEHERAFVADASHELRTPLAILRTELELALAAGRTPGELRAALASAAEETDRLTQLTEDLLTIAQTERGVLPLRLARTDLAEALAGVKRRFSRRAEDAGRSIEAGPAALEIEADRLRLDQAVGSMVDNALRYGAGPIEVRASAAGGRIEIHVLDRGAGFPEEFLGRAFERFSRASASNHDGGSGLGLAIVQTVARAHGGEAHAANREGGGADVWLTLPARGAQLSSGVNQSRR